MPELSEETKQKIESLSPDEMAYEINLGNRSRFQREKFAYLKSVYEKRLPNNNASPEKENKENSNQSPLIRIAEGVFIGILVWCVAWIIGHYLNIDL